MKIKKAHQFLDGLSEITNCTMKTIKANLGIIFETKKPPIKVA